jgi:hypothetical protein
MGSYYETISQIAFCLQKYSDNFVKVSAKNSDKYFYRHYDYYKKGIKIGSVYYDSCGDLCDAKLFNCSLEHLKNN